MNRSNRRCLKSFMNCNLLVPIQYYNKQELTQTLNASMKLLRSTGWLKLALFALIPFFTGCAGSKNSATGNNAATIFFDDFSQPSLDRTKWNVAITGEVVNNEQQAYVDSSATIYTV